MQPETEQIYDTLKLLIGQNLPFKLPGLVGQKLPFNLPGHDHGGDIYPFVWDGAQGSFSILSLCHANGWLKVTDVEKTIKDWQEMNYIKHFPDLHFKSNQTKDLPYQIESLFQILNTHLNNLKSYVLNSSNSYVDHPGIIIGKTKDEDWICVSPTVYTETTISEKQISRSSILKQTSPPLSENTLDIIAQIQTITSEIGRISLHGDFGGGIMYNFDYRIVYAIAASRESALRRALQSSGMLRVSQFRGIHRDRKYLNKCYSYKPNINEIYQKYEKINLLFSQAFPKVVMYRFSFWTDENLYIIGQTSGGDWAGIYINSQFVYNP